jgi:hypothetical protein
LFMVTSLLRPLKQAAAGTLRSHFHLLLVNPLKNLKTLRQKKYDRFLYIKARGDY